ncbi:MAG: hypothetical protein QNJ74_22420 [Trichodesmium sp. MO_231.B1]|nr:hypothetical protein [Trichodesmium sp. MO_231.B1]
MQSLTTITGKNEVFMRMRRDGFRFAKQPAYYPSIKDSDNVRVCTEWVKEND